MKQEHITFISQLFPFKNLDTKVIEKVISEYDFSVSEFSKGDVIFSPSNFEKKIGFVIDGECRVVRLRDEDDSVSLNTLSRYASFGIMSVLSSEEEYPTHIIASKNSSILFISGNDMLSMIKAYPDISMNVINFLAGRIAFLNRKVTTFSGKRTVQKLASYLLAKFRESGEIISISRTKLACELGIGRASVYRDIDFLIEEGLIKVNQKQIIINCPEGLERI